MMKNLFKRRFIYDDTVYLLVKDCAGVLDITTDDFHHLSNNILDISGIGEAVPENEYNRILSEHFPDKKDGMQFTRVETLETKKSDIVKLYPVKRLFAEEMFMINAAELCMTVDEYIDLIDYPDELEKEKKKIEWVNSIEESILKYQETFEKNMPSREILEKYGLEVQTLTILNNYISYMTFLVGDGVFYSLHPEFAEDDEWEESTMDSDGNITVPSWQYTGGKYEIKRNKERDFRKYSVLENIIYIVENIIPKNEWTDYFEFRDDGINLSLHKDMLMKFVNPKYLTEEYYFEGIPEIKSNVIQTKEDK